MAAYAREHYGIDSWRLVRPKVIVEHFTAGGTYQSAWNTFAHDVPDQEFHSLPADCAHFIIDTDGTIHQLVPLGIMAWKACTDFLSDRESHSILYHPLEDWTPY